LAASAQAEREGAAGADGEDGSYWKRTEIKRRWLAGRMPDKARSNVADWQGRRTVVAMTFLACALLMIAGTSHAQTAAAPAAQAEQPAQKQPLPDAPGSKQPRQSPNPVQTVEDNTKEAAESTEHAVTDELIRARDWESTWISGAYLGKQEKMSRLTKKQREEIYLRQTWTTPQAYMKRMFEAGIDQARGVPSQWDDGWAGYAERFASREGQFITANTFAAFGDAALGYEVRYNRCRCSGSWKRIRHALARNFLTYNRTEQEMRPQWALYAGAFGGGMVATSWKPGPNNAWANGGWAVLGQAGYGTLLNLVIEFSREINREQGVNK
jgi:hypothetical protein